MQWQDLADRVREAIRTDSLRDRMKLDFYSEICTVTARSSSVIMSWANGFLLLLKYPESRIQEDLQIEKIVIKAML